MRRDRDRDFVPLPVLLRGVWNRRPQCTRCGASRIIPSRQVIGLLGRLLLLTAYRCRECNRRFALHLPADDYWAIRDALKAAVAAEDRRAPAAEDLPDA